MKTYLVGGAVRDELLGREVHDRDYVVTGVTIEQMLEAGFNQVGADFPVFLHPKTKEEYALARTERKSGSGYKGFTVDFNPQVTLEEDLMRRDLTINAIAKDEDGHFVDPYGGRKDLTDGILRHVSDAFVEDPLRVLRVARFAAQLNPFGFKVDDKTNRLMAKLAGSGELSCLTAERVFKETEKALCCDNPDVYFRALKSADALLVLFGEFEHIVGEFSDGVFEQAMMAIVRGVDLSDLPQCRWAVMLGAMALNSKQEQSQTLAVVDELNQRLRVPNRYQILTRKVIELFDAVDKLTEQSPEVVLSVLEKLDVFRKEEILAPFIACFQAIKGEPAVTAAQAQLLRDANRLCQRVTAKPFVEQGLKGIAIKQAITEQRLANIAPLL